MDKNNLINMLSSFLFWDTDNTKLDPQKHIRFLIPRVMDYGTWEDVRLIIDHYGKAEMLAVLLDAPYLDPKTISFCEMYFETPRTRFKAYQRSKNWQIWK